MSDAEEKLKEHISRIWHIDDTKKTIELVIDVLLLDCKNIDSKKVDNIINNRQAEIEAQKDYQLKVRNTRESIDSYFYSLILASIEKTIEDKGYFRFSASSMYATRDGIENPFSQSASEMYEVVGNGAEYDDSYDEEKIRLNVMLKGKLGEAIKELGHDRFSIWVKFTDHYDDREIIIDKKEDIKRKIDEVEARIDRGIGLDKLESVVDVIKRPGNANLTMWLMKNPH